MQDLELRIAEVEGGSARRWTKQEAEEKSRAVEQKMWEREAKERRRGRAEVETEGECTLAKESEGTQMVRPRWMLVQTSISEY